MQTLFVLRHSNSNKHSENMHNMVLGTFAEGKFADCNYEAQSFAAWKFRCAEFLPNVVSIFISVINDFS